MKKLNITLILGILILVLIVFTLIFPQLLTSRSPYTVQMIRSFHLDGNLEFEFAPYSPSSDLPLGSDDLGRDILSLIVYGTRLTLLLGLLIAVGRFIVALPIALMAGFGNQSMKSFISQFNILFSAIPALLISIIILKLEFFADLDKVQSIIAFTVVLVGVGWPKMSKLIMERVEAINLMPFVKGEVAIGKSRFRIAIENVIPHLAPELIVLFFMEIARALAMIMQLGIFSLFIGNLHIIKDTGFGFISYYDLSFEPEWASMLASSRNLLSTAPWAVLYPALAFFVSVLGFNLCGEGLRKAMQRKGSKVIPNMRKLLILDIKTIIKGISRKAKITTTVLVLIVFVVSISVSVYSSTNDKYEFIVDEPSLEYDSVIIGSEEAFNTSETIITKMKDIGVEIVKDDSYIKPYESIEACIPENESLVIDINGTTIDTTLNKDYTYITLTSFEGSGEIYDLTNESLYDIKDYSKFDNKFVLIDKSLYNDNTINYYKNEIIDSSNTLGVLLIAAKNESLVNPIPTQDKEAFVILISQDLADKILQDTDNVQISISAEVKKLEPLGNNIIGIYNGFDEYIAEEAIVITMSYNYLDAQGAEVLQFNLELMEKICSRNDNKRSIIFAFIDGTISENYNGLTSFAEDFPYPTGKTQLCIDLTGLTVADFDEIEFSTEQAPITNAFAWSIGNQLGKNLDEKNIIVNALETIVTGIQYYFPTEGNSGNAMFWTRGIPTIIVNTETQGNKTHTVEEIGSILLEVIDKNNY